MRAAVSHLASRDAASLLPLVMTIKCEEQVRHVPIALMEERQVVGLHREEKHENEPPVVHDRQPEHRCLSKMTLADLYLVLEIMPDDVEGGVILKSKVEVLSVTRPDEVEQSLRCELDILLLLDEALHQQPLQCFADGLEAEEGLGVCLST